jgi:hypothetical protein
VKPWVVCAAVSSLALGACTQSRRANAPIAPPTWIDAPLMFSGGGADERARLADLAADPTDAGARLARFDRLIDLFDAARFSGADGTREALWSGLPESTEQRGVTATRTATQSLLDQAYALERDLGDRLGDDALEFLNDAIMLLAVDANPPYDDDSLSTQALAHITLLESGHPRIQDNARWRVYDHVRDVLDSALEASPHDRVRIAPYALLAEQDSIQPWLDWVGPHARPAFPSPQTFVDLLAAQREALALESRWAAVVASREAEDAVLSEGVLAGFPQPRQGWTLAKFDRGTGRPESFAPVLQVRDGMARLDADAPHEQRFFLTNPELVSAIGKATARDGRQTLLFVAEPMSPAPDLRMGMKAAAAAGVRMLELAIAEPTLDAAAGDEVVVALPLYVVGEGDPGAGAEALRSSRIRLHIAGRGPRVAIDDTWLPDQPGSAEELRTLLKRVKRAYPRQRALAVGLGGDAQPQQVFDALAVVVGGPTPLFDGAGWLVGQPREPDPGSIAANERVTTRVALAGLPPSISEGLELSRDDQARFEVLAGSFSACVPELEAAPGGSLSLELRFEAGVLARVEIQHADAKRASLDAVADCARRRARDFRLREREDALDARVVFELPRLL